MNNIENSIEKDPHLRRNDSLSNDSSDPSRNKWMETMKDAPSFSEHMKQMDEERIKSKQHAFSQTSERKPSSLKQTNGQERARGNEVYR